MRLRNLALHESLWFAAEVDEEDYDEDAAPGDDDEEDGEDDDEDEDGEEGEEGEGEEEDDVSGEVRIKHEMGWMYNSDVKSLLALRRAMPQH